MLKVRVICDFLRRPWLCSLWGGGPTEVFSGSVLLKRVKNSRADVATSLRTPEAPGRACQALGSQRIKPSSLFPGEVRLWGY